jgi:Zn-dependent peptidase ImmA (M78 family)
MCRKEGRIELLARNFKVSPIVAARRLKDLRLIDNEEFFDFYRDYMRREADRTRSRTSGGNFYNNQNTRVGEYFASRVVHAAFEGRIGFKTAYDLTGLQGGVFQRYARTLGFDLP